MNRRVLDAELRVWEAFPNPVAHAAGGLQRLVFRCLSDPRLPVRATEPKDPEALRAVLRQDPGRLPELLDGATPLD